MTLVDVKRHQPILFGMDGQLKDFLWLYSGVSKGIIKFALNNREHTLSTKFS